MEGFAEVEQNKWRHWAWGVALLISLSVHGVLVLIPEFGRYNLAGKSEGRIHVRLIRPEPSVQANVLPLVSAQDAGVSHSTEARSVEPIIRSVDNPPQAKPDRQEFTEPHSRESETPPVSKWLRSYLNGEVKLSEVDLGEANHIDTKDSKRLGQAKYSDRVASPEGTVTVGLDQHHQYAGHCFLERAIWDGSKSVPVLYPTECDPQEDDSKRFLDAVNRRMKVLSK